MLKRFLHRKTASRLRVHGFLDSIDNGRVTGWAIDPYDPRQPVQVIAYRDDRPVGIGRADLFRPDLTAETPGGRCGFSFPIEVDAEDVFVAANAVRLPRSSAFSYSASKQSRSRFEARPPCAQNALDIFSGSWASDLAEVLPGTISGNAPHFVTDTRPQAAATGLGLNGRLDGMRVLELGPLEGGHTYALEKLGADVLAIESNSDAYLKCLIVKELTSLKAKFMLGDVTEFLTSTRERFDLVFACGILYHMRDPITVIENICRVTDRCYVWSHVFDEACYSGPPRNGIVDPRYPEMTLWDAGYGDTVNDSRFWGGNGAYSRWMRTDDMLSLFDRHGLKPFDYVPPEPASTLAAISFCAKRN